MEEKKKNNEKEKPEKGPFVTITVDNQQFEIHRGNQSVEEIKTLAGVPLADELNLLVDGELKPLPSDGSVVIKGGEEFVSQPPSGAAS